MRFPIIAGGLLLIAFPQIATAATAKRAAFGTLPDGRAVEAVTLTGANGVTARIMTLGATLQAFDVPDRDGKIADITLGQDDAASYVRAPNYWGQTIGRMPTASRTVASCSTARAISCHSTTRPIRCTVARTVSTKGCGGSSRWKAARRRKWCWP